MDILSVIFFPWVLKAEPKTQETPDSFQAEQILLLVGKPGDSQGELYFFRVEDGEWQSVLSAVPIWFGRNGIIPKEQKREGDGFTPYGTYPILRVFGKTRKTIRNLEYTQIGKNDHWSDVITSKHYNQFLRNKEKGATSLWNSPIYQLFIVLEHNTNPSIPGNGSMLFLHPWEETKPTSGCVGMKLADLEMIVQNLDGKKNPFILIVSSDETNKNP